MTASQKQIPTNIMLEKWADVGFVWQGMVNVVELERLIEHLDVSSQLLEKQLDVVATLKKHQGILWLSYQVKAVLWLVCQRCLLPVAVDVSGDYRLAILQNESQIGQIADAEFVLVDEICAGDGRQMLPLKAMLEDELLLALPLSARHDDCQLPSITNKTKTGDGATDKAESPFAVLAQLKHKN
ncbi:MAG: DUF177 domain-containing protein [Moraxella sp.]|nr:DUF177 domain-containing protein [Moraxella sp.]